MLTFFVAGVPVPKARARVVNGHAFTPERTVEWEQTVRQAFNRAYPSHQPYGPDVALSVEIKAEMPGKGKRARIRSDCDNLAKSCLDALEGLAYTNDRQVVELYVGKRRVGKTSLPGVHVRIQVVEQ